MTKEIAMTDAATLSGERADRSTTTALRAARMMGWTSFGLAALFIARPGQIARTLGLEGKENLIRGFGVQEVLAGMGALSIDAPTAMWARAGGDVIHIAATATALRSEDPRQRRNAGWAIAALGGFLLVDALIAARLGAERNPERGERRDYADRSGFPKGIPSTRQRSSADAEPQRRTAAVTATA